MGLGTAVLAVGAVGTALSATESYKQSQYQAGVMRQNAQIAKNNAQIASIEGQQQQQQQGMRTAQEVGQQTAAFAGSGINTQSASAQNVIAGTRAAGISDQSMLRFNQQAEVQGYDTQAAQDLSSAKALSAAAPISAFGTILGGASSLGNQWAMYQKFGVNSW